MHAGISILALVTVFLFAVSKFSKQIQTIFGKRLRRILSTTTDSPAKGIVTGFLVTTIVQSSTAVSVLLVTLSSAHIISFSGALAVIIGANIGTTLTLQLVAFKILGLAPYILITGFILSKIDHPSHIYGKPIFYFGLIFSSLYIISIIAESWHTSPLVLTLISHADSLWIGILYGFILCNILQSSTLTSSVIVIFAGQDILSLEQSIGLLYGANIGTTTTALVASFVTNKYGMRVAVAHVLFNMVTVLLFVPFTTQFAEILRFLSQDISMQVAHAHLLLNCIGALLFYIGFSYYQRIVIKLVP